MTIAMKAANVTFEKTIQLTDTSRATFKFNGYGELLTYVEYGFNNDYFVRYAAVLNANTHRPTAPNQEVTVPQEVLDWLNAARLTLKVTP